MYCKKIEIFFLQYPEYIDPTHIQMTVNPSLAALMRVIEDHQDKMPEGEYLEAMNALGALHREATSTAALAAARFSAHAIPVGPPPSYMPPASLFTAQHTVVPGMEDRVEQAAWYRVKNEHPEHFGISAQEWIGFSQEQRDRLIREATEIVVNKLEHRCRNPEPEECPFIARHAVGTWRMAGSWECACGYKGFCKNWKKHEQSERHQDWAKHRTVSRRKIEIMKQAIRRDEGGDLTRFKPLSRTNFGGIRCFLTSQERNEWTNPELYDPIHRGPVPTADGVGRWFVHYRELWARVYVQ